MSAEHLQYTQDTILRMRVADVVDPGDAGTIRIENKGFSIARIATAGPETRTLEAYDHFGVGTKCLVILETDGGDLTVNGVVLTNAGDCVEFVVTTSGWERVSGSPADTSGVTAVAATPDAAEVAASLISFSQALVDAGVISTAIAQA